MSSIIKRLVKEDSKVAQPGEIPARSLPDNTAVIDSVNRYVLALRRTAAFKLYEGLFSLWHILHLPLFIMMIITAVIHIFAVHLY